MILSDGVNVLHDGLDDTGRYYNAPSVVENYVVVSVAFVRSCDLAHRSQRPGNVGDVPAASDLTVCTFNVGNTLAELLDHFSSCA